MKFNELEFGPRIAMSEGVQALHFFPNGYGVSVIRGHGTYGSKDGLYELAIVKRNGEDWDICCDSGLADDVIGHLTEAGVSRLMEQVCSL